MKFLNQIDGADKLIQDSDNRLVTDTEKAGWDSKASGVHEHTKSDITDFPTSMPANGGNASTVNGKTVDENVPAGAKFTDTIVDISGKADKSQVLTNVPANAKFTDTIYSHPETHPYSMITGTPSSLPADGGNADTVSGFTVLKDVPADANFRNTTYSVISTAEIDAGTASTSRVVSGARVKYIIDKVTPTIGITKPTNGSVWYEVIG